MAMSSQVLLSIMPMVLVEHTIQAVLAPEVEWYSLRLRLRHPHAAHFNEVPGSGMQRCYAADVLSFSPVQVKPEPSVSPYSAPTDRCVSAPFEVEVDATPLSMGSPARQC